MKLFFKHLLRSIRGRPRQPIILAFTLSLAVAVSSIILSLRTAIFNEGTLEFTEKFGSADIMISVNSSSESRFLFVPDVKASVPGASVAGYYDLVASDSEGEIVIGAATDFATVGEIFDISFTEYGKITEDNLEDSVVISPALAERVSLGVGDSFTAILFGKSCEYTVQGVSATPVFSSCDFVLDIGGVMKLIADDSVFAAIIGEDFKPYSTVFIDLADDSEVGAVIDSLRAQAEFSDKTVSSVPKAGGVNVLELVILFAVILSLIMTSVVSFCCFSILERERSIENEAFAIAGAGRGMLHLIQYAEALIYWFFGTLFGSLLAVPISYFVNYHINFRYTEAVLSVEDTLTSSLLLLGVLLATFTVFILSGGVKRKVGHKLLLPLAITVGAVCFVLEFLLPEGVRFTFGIYTVLALLVLVFLTSDKIICFAARKIGGKMDKNPTRLSLYYAIKNVVSVKALHNTMRLTALLFAALATIFTIISSLRGNVVVMGNFFDAEYSVLNATARCRDKLSACESVKSVEGAYFTSYAHDGSYYTTILSVSDVSLFSDSVPVENRPTGDEAVISYAEARMLSLKVGDSFTLELSGEQKSFSVIEIVKTGFNFVLVDSEYIGVDYNMIIPIPKPDVTSVNLISDISGAMAGEIATLSKNADILNSRMGSFNVYTRSGDLLLITVGVFALIGLLDTTAQSYNVRAAEFELYRVGGMSRRAARRLKLYEILTVTFSGILIGVFGYLIILPIIREAMYGIGYELLINLAKLL